ncbi:tetratricopeptide repeat protein [Streptomyces sp. AC627_RSS907]|uniref:tetratricopeptide repeat protein n=1 Tax=Streptomyces sp. AC627_RSS907 TaxID=2823684 RepID=UPI001C21544C
MAGHLEQQRRVDEAAGLLRAAAAEGDPHVILPLAELVARHGRIDEAIEVLRPLPHALGREGNGSSAPGAAFLSTMAGRRKPSPASTISTLATALRPTCIPRAGRGARVRRAS